MASVFDRCFACAAEARKVRCNRIISKIISSFGDEDCPGKLEIIFIVNSIHESGFRERELSQGPCSDPHFLRPEALIGHFVRTSAATDST